jgi:hypothetical protein
MQNRPLPDDDPTGYDVPIGWTPTTLPYRSPGGPALVVELLLALFMLVTLAAVASDLVELNLLNRLLHDPTSVLEAEVSASDSRQALLTLLQAGAYLVTGVGFLVWFHRAYANLPALGIEPLPYATGWAVGAWLVPVLGLFRPKQIMDHIWRGSDPGRPWLDAFWRNGPVPLLAHLWWALYLATWVVDRAVAVLKRNGSSSVAGLRAGGVGDLVSDGLWLVLGLLCFELVRRATRRQRERAVRFANPPLRH